MFPGGMEVGQEELEALRRVIESKNLFRYYGVGKGPDEVASFEREFAELMGAKHALCLNAGSSALICALIGAGVGEGDEVIVPAYTWNATPNAVLASRAIPALAEVDESLTLDPEDVERRITSRTRAIVPVHMRGAPAVLATPDGDRGTPRPRADRGRLPGGGRDRSAAAGSARSVTRAPSVCSSTRSSPPAKAAS
jgi:Predicted pyridoxal phosphate-dependent enzyme apparently involved in regulation of cell wall biogenesis